MASFTVQLVRKFEDENNGVAYNEGSILVSKQDSDELIDLYSDPQLTVPLSNPFTANSEGLGTFYCDDGIYDLTLGDLNGENLFVPDVLVSDNDDSIPIGTTVLQNGAKSNPNFIPRDNGTYQTAIYPLLAGTPGFPYSGTGGILGYNLEPEHTAAVASSTNSQAFERRSSVTQTGLVLKNNGTNGFLYSNNDGFVEALAVNGSGATIYDVATDDSAYIVAVGLGGIVDVYDRNTFALLGSQTVGISTIRSVFWDSNNNWFVIINEDREVYTNAIPTDPWFLEVQIPISSNPGNNYIFERTQTGFIAEATIGGNVYHCSNSIFQGGTATLVESITSATGFKTIDSSFNDGLNGLLITSDGTGRTTMFSSFDGGVSFSEITPVTAIDTGALITRLIKVTDDAYCAISGSVTTPYVWFTVDFGDNWTRLDPIFGADFARDFFKTSEDNFVLSNNSTGRIEMLAQSSAGQDQFTSTELLGPNATDFYYTKAR